MPLAGRTDAIQVFTGILSYTVGRGGVCGWVGVCTCVAPAAVRRVYVRTGDSWRGNLLVQGVKNLADTISHKVSQH